MTILFSRKNILFSAGALFIAAVVLTGGVLPAEYGIDPLGIGRATGTIKLHAVPEKTQPADKSTAPNVQSYTPPYRSNVIDIPLDTYESGNASEVEYKVAMRKGEALVYSWSVTENVTPDDIYSEFHGHTLGQTVTVAYYRKSAGSADNGALIAPFDGVHGWYFQNSSARPVTIHLRISGFYALIPAGLTGNEASLSAK
ncbi:hypothetical protein [Asticcacaulis sp.]|uniref:hypothetical protein n=1 Tax=Asticcacaulis sp. TaxID=1872648 RepID=UPI002BE25436|nr:hypothetical protein [Asticcacaulis sp.]HTM81582.1 hypothetical protein [Asticcacaulis sp.]